VRKVWSLVLLSAVLGAGCATLSPSADRAVIRAKDRVAPALVHIRPVKEVYAAGKREEVVVIGSGFIISRDGYVVTNEHVAGESKLVRCVLYNKEELEAEVVGTDPFTDIAVLKLVTDRNDLPTVRLGTSRNLEAGQTVLALGSPHGLARSVSRGIVSVPDRYLGDWREVRAPYNTWIQTDAAINQGNSGGPLVNLRGVVVGVNARRLSNADNVGFAIPIDTAKEVVEQIIANGRVKRSWIGVSFQEMTSKTQDPSQNGVVIADVDPLSPGGEAGLRPGDIMVALNGKPTDARFVEDLPVVRKMVADLPVGEEATVRIRRGDEETDVKVTTVEKGDLRGDEIELPEWGLTVSEVTPFIVRRARLDAQRGVVVSGTQVGGVAGKARLARGDIILTMDGEEVENLAHFRQLYADRVASGQKLVLMDVKSGALTRYVLVKQDDTNGDETEQALEENADGDTADNG